MMRELAAKSSLPWCMIGDFNDIVSMEEKRGGRVQPRSLIEGFSEAINNCGLEDLGFVGDHFTWEKCRGGLAWVQERLDRRLTNQDWKELFPRAEVIVLDVTTSDHLPLNIQLNMKVYVPSNEGLSLKTCG